MLFNHNESQSRARVLLSRRVFVDQLQNRNARGDRAGSEFSTRTYSLLLLSFLNLYKLYSGTSINDP